MCEQNNEVSVGHIGGEQDAGAGDSHCCLLHDEGTKGVVGAVEEKGGVPGHGQGPGWYPGQPVKVSIGEAPAPSASKLVRVPGSLVTPVPLSACHESGTDSLSGAGDLSVSGKR